ncbi:MAG: cation/acetate symporter, partial [Porticoccaceae bacterium]
MIYEPSIIAVVSFFVFVGLTLGISFWLGRKATDSKGYFAAHGQIPWFVNGVAFAGDYLSAASFLGICGMIAFYGYDGFLYSIGYLAGWIVALFVIAEPMKRLGKFTFADALDAKFQSPGIKLAAGISTLAVSIFYLIPQMVGAGVLVQPLLGFDHWVGVVIVGVTVILIVVTAGMVSTTWVQFIKGTLLVVFSAILTVMLFAQGFKTAGGGNDGYEFQSFGPMSEQLDEGAIAETLNATVVAPDGGWSDTKTRGYVRFKDNETGRVSTWSYRSITTADGADVFLDEAQTVGKDAKGNVLVNSEIKGKKKGEPELHPVGHISKLPGGVDETGPLGPLSFFSTLQESEVVLWGSEKVTEANDTTTTVYFQKPTPGSQILRPGEHPKFKGIRSDSFVGKLNFLSLMLALFCGTASL